MAEPKKKEQERKTNDKVLNEEELKKVTGGVNQSGYEKNPANIGPHLAGFLHYSDYNLHSLLNEVIDEVLNDSQNNYNVGKKNEKRIYRTKNGNFSHIPEDIITTSGGLHGGPHPNVGVFHTHPSEEIFEEE